MDFDDFGGMPADEFYLMESLREDEEEMRRQEEEDRQRQEEDEYEEYEKQKDRDLSHIVFEQERINRRAAYSATGGGCCMIAIGIPLILIIMGVLIFFV